jgi:hypothetical protein
MSSRRGPRRIRARVAAGLLCTAALAWVIYALSFVYSIASVRGPDDAAFEIAAGLLYVRSQSQLPSPGQPSPRELLVRRATEWRAPQWECSFRDRGPRGWWFALPIQYPVASLTVVGLVLLRKKQRSSTACSACGYELQGVPDDAKCCPECGATRAN